MKLTRTVSIWCVLIFAGGFCVVFLIQGCKKNKFSGVSSAVQQKSTQVAPIANPTFVDETDVEAPDIETLEDIFHQESNCHFITTRGDYIHLHFLCSAVDNEETQPYIFTTNDCNFKVNYASYRPTQLVIDAFKNDKPFFKKVFDRSLFNDVFNFNFLKRFVIVGAEFFEYNDRYDQYIIKCNLAERMGGTEWFAQAYIVLDNEGKLIHKGLVDYPHHCDGLLTLSADKNYLLSCSEIYFFGDRRKKSHISDKVVLAEIINDSLFTIVYDNTKDSTICDTIIYLNDDTLSYAVKQSYKDTLSSNAFLLHTNGDTLVRFKFNGYVDAGESYIAHFQFLKSQNIAAYYDYTKKIIRMFDVDKELRETIVQVRNLKQTQKVVEESTFVEFLNRPNSNFFHKVRFYFDDNRKINSYSYLPCSTSR
jgi:hypothetical protein